MAASDSAPFDAELVLDAVDSEQDFAPVLVDDAFEAHQNDGERQFKVLANDQFPDGDSADQAIAAVSYGSQGGSIEIAPGGRAVIYSPPRDFAGTETFSYFLGDAQATVTVIIAAVVQPDSASGFAGGPPVALRVLGNDPFWSAYPGPRVITAVGEAALGGTAEIAADGRSILYTPPETGTGLERFIYVVDDRFSAEVTIDVRNPLQSDSFEVHQNDEARTLDVLENDESLGGNAGRRVITAVSFASQGGTIEISEDGRAVVYAPPADFVGTESFAYFVGEESASVTVTVLPVVAPDYASAFTAGRPIQLGVLENDPFWHGYHGRRLITSVSGTTLGGTVEIAADGRSIAYTPPEFGTGKDAFVYVVDDLFPAEVDVWISSPVNADEFPRLVMDTAENVLDVLANDVRDSDNVSLDRITHIFAAGLQGTAAIAADGRSILFTPQPGFVGSQSFTYVVDGVHEARVTIWVNRPVQDDSFNTHANTSRLLKVTRNDLFFPPNSSSGSNPTPVDVIDRVTFVSATARGGRVAISSDGQGIEYTPPNGFFGDDSFEYFADGKYTARVSVTVPRPVADDWFPLDVNSTNARLDVTANDQSVFWEHPGGYSSADVIDRVTFVGDSEQGGSVRISDDGRAIIYTPPRGYVGNDSFTYIADGAFEARVTIQTTNPVRDDQFEVRLKSEQVFLDVLNNDFYGNGYTGERRVTGVSVSDFGGELQIAPGGTGILYTLPRDFRGTDHFAYSVDGDLHANVTVSIRPRAILTPDWLQVCAGQTDVQLDVLQNDPRIEPDPGETIITGVTQPVQGGSGSVRVAPDGRSLLFSSGGLDSSYYSFSYEVLGESTTTVAIYNEFSVYANWDIAVANQNSATQSIDVLANDYFGQHWRCGMYSGPREVTAVSATVYGGVVAIAADRKSVHYTPTPDFVGTDSFTYRIDGGPQATVSVAVIRRVRDDRFHVEADSGPNELAVLVNDLFGATYVGAGRISSITQTSAGGSAIIANDGGGISYTPRAGFRGVDTFQYTVDGKLKASVSVLVGVEADEHLPRFDSAADFTAFLLERADRIYGNLFGTEPWFSRWNYSYGFDGDGDVVFGHSLSRNDAVALAPTSVAITSAPARTHSDTNVQVAGVDEADVIENDGEFLYVVAGGELLIARAWPADELAVVSRVAIAGSPVGAYLHGDRLAVVSRMWGNIDRTPLSADDSTDATPAAANPPQRRWPGSARTIVTLLDVSDRAEPRLLRETELDGVYVESRRIDEHVYLVLQNDISLPAPEIVCEAATAPAPTVDPNADKLTVLLDTSLVGADWYFPRPAPAKCAYETRRQYAERLAALTDSLPQFFTFGRDNELLASGFVSSPDQIVRPESADGWRLLSVASLNMSGDDSGLAASTGVLSSSASKIYGSPENLYVFDQGFSVEDGATTQILQFDWNPSEGSVRLQSKGEVAGTMLNQFSADEFAGNLRIATTIGNAYSGNWSGRSENALFVLRDDAGVLEFVGSLSNLGLSETIRSVRFMGERAFVTTFRDVDPLFALDLSDPADPRVAGHVTLPGFNSYMQFIDSDHILAVGRNAARGTLGPTQVALFDVSDLARPRLIDRDVLPRYTESIAEADHHAFGYFAEHGLLALPTSRTGPRRVDRNGDGYRESIEWSREDELFLFQIDASAAASSESGIELLGDLDHDSAVLRAAFIDDVLYSVAERSITAVNVADPTQRFAEIHFEPLVDRPVEPPSVYIPPVHFISPMFRPFQSYVLTTITLVQLPDPPQLWLPSDVDPPAPQPPDDHLPENETREVVAPNVSDVRVLTRRRRVTAIEIHFDGDLDAAVTSDLTRFELHMARHGRRLSASRDLTLPVRSATYDASKRVLSLTPAGQFRIGQEFTIVVKLSIASASGTTPDSATAEPFATIPVRNGRWTPDSVISDRSSAVRRHRSNLSSVLRRR